MMEAILLKETRGRLDEAEQEKRNIIERVRKLYVANNMKPLDFKYKDSKGFVEYLPNVWIRDIGSELGNELGITVLHAMVKENTNVPSHQHDKQYQTIYVKSGKIFDEETGRLYLKGECIFVKKGHIHDLQFYALSEYIISYQPNLPEG